MREMAIANARTAAGVSKQIARKLEVLLYRTIKIAPSTEAAAYCQAAPGSSVKIR